MKKIIAIGLLIFIISAVFTLKSPVKLKDSENYVSTNGTLLYTETFGSYGNPTILLNAGAFSIGLNWTDQFCNMLVESGGFFVIRYDYRGTGLSQDHNFETQPYTVLDLTRDAIGILDFYKIEKAHFFGFSLGGQVAQFAGAYFKDRVASLIIMGSSGDFKPAQIALAGERNIDKLPPPTSEVLDFRKNMEDVDNLHTEQKIAQYVNLWKIYNGKNVEFHEDIYRDIAKNIYSRSKLYNFLWHQRRAMTSSRSDHERAVTLIDRPTLIIHGSADPMFPVEHGVELNKHINKSNLVVIKGMGHSINPIFYEVIVEHVKNQISIF